MLLGDLEPKLTIDDDADQSSTEDKDSDNDDSTKTETTSQHSREKDSLSPSFDNDDARHTNESSYDAPMGTQEIDIDDSDKDHERSSHLEEELQSMNDEKESTNEKRHGLKRWPGSESLNVPDLSGGKAFGIKCRQCNKTFARMSKYNNHMNTHAT